ncbi:hypothetical protein N8D56_14095 [Devosia sp. A8/3-2]|nr:hypothetical protein N8D56_14095 [Devosia sp. A8/3-2]
MANSIPEALGFLKAGIERQISLYRRLLEFLDRPVGQIGGTHRVRHHLAHHVLVGMQPLEALVEDHAIADGQSQKNGDRAFHEYPEGQTEHHRPSTVSSSSSSKAAMVTLGGLSGRVTRTET